MLKINEKGKHKMIVLALVFLLVVTGILLFIDKRRFISGVVFLFSLWSLFLYLFLKLFTLTLQTSNVGALVILVFVLIGIVVIPLFTGFFMISNTYRYQLKEGKSFTAKLALFFGINLIILFSVGIGLLFYAQYWNRYTNTFLISFLGLNVSFSFTFLNYLFYSFFYQCLYRVKQTDYIIVLGAGVTSDTVTPLLKSRLDQAILVYNKLNQKPTFVVSGGKGKDEPLAEALVMKHYLCAQHIPFENILVEAHSTNTLENMLFSKEKIMQDWKKKTPPNILFSTSNYHVLRSALFAKKAGLNAQGIGSPVSFYFLPNALLREFIALLFMHKGFTGCIFVFWLLVGIFLTHFI